MNVVQLKEKLFGNVEYIEKVLERLGCGKITYLRGNGEIRCALDLEPDSNGNSLRIKVDTAYVVSFSDRLHFNGDIISLVQHLKKCKLNEAIKWICSILGFSYEGYTPITKTYTAFGGYWEGFKDNGNIDSQDTYDESILNKYLDRGNFQFLKDGISFLTQSNFNIRYDLESNRIVIPWRNSNGEIVALIGRWLGEDYEECGEPKYKPLKPIVGFKKNLNLFGYSENYKDIQTTQTLFIVESEKGVLQAHTMGLKNFVAVGSHSLSETQRKLVYSLQPKTIIVGYDEDVAEEYLKEECMRLKQDIPFFSFKVGYIYDKENKYLVKNSKQSITDNGINSLKGLLKDCLIYV